VWVGLDTAETRSSTADDVFTTVALFLSAALGILAFIAVGNFLIRRRQPSPADGDR
jgi:hypothetical protein